MTGTCFVVHEKGWACSNEVSLDVEKDIEYTPEGNTIARQTNTLKINSIFNGLGIVELDAEVDCLFMVENTNTVNGYKGRVTGKGGDLTVITLLSEHDNIKEVLTKINI